MFKYTIGIVFCFVYALIFNVLQAQSPYQTLLDGGGLSGKYQKKLKQADDLLRKGEMLFAEAEETANEIDVIEKADRKQVIKMTRLQEQEHRLNRSAGSYIEDAHRMQYKILARALKKGCRTGYIKTEPKARRFFEEGVAFRRKSDQVSFRGNIVNLLEKATDLEQKSLNLLASILLKVSMLDETDLALVTEQTFCNGDLTKEANEETGWVSDLPEPDTVVVDIGIMEEVNPEPDTVRSRLSQLTEPDLVQAKVPEVDTSTEPAVYFTIQILVSRIPLAEQKINATYNGKLPVFKNRGEGWYRYSAGKFVSLSEAKDALELEVIKGFITAYRGQKRITVKEALMTRGQ